MAWLCHRRPVLQDPWRRYGSWTMSHIDLQTAPTHGSWRTGQMVQISRDTLSNL